MYFDSTDRKLLNLVQANFPLSEEPYADLGSRLGVGGDEVIDRLSQLKEKGNIRQISPVIDGKLLGYQSTLVAMKVSREQLEKAKQLLGKHPGVSHNYERNHRFNLWFTLALPPGVDLDGELGRLTKTIGAEAAFTLPTVKMFKISVFFDIAEDGQTVAPNRSDGTSSQPVELSPADRLVINELQQDLALIPRPFDAIARQVNIEVADFLAQCQSLQQRGIIRRFGAAINHIKTGFTANAMACWVVAPDKVDIVGEKLASLPEVSHCYQRQTNPLWPYNLFTMIHGHTREFCQDVTARMAGEIGLADYILLFSSQELKKTRIKYLV